MEFGRGWGWGWGGMLNNVKKAEKKELEETEQIGSTK